MTHKQWLDNEYRQWIEALQASTPYNFKDHPMVKRMLGDFEWPTDFLPSLSVNIQTLITTIDDIGRQEKGFISGVAWRMIYYARQVLSRNPESIVEIGGGVGEFYAIMRALGYQGDYCILDISEVQHFQQTYLQTVWEKTGLYLKQRCNLVFCVSFYALGEFDDELKKIYVETIVSKCAHGFVIWNPHSGASSEVPFKCKVTDEFPLMNEGNKQLEW